MQKGMADPDASKRCAVSRAKMGAMVRSGEYVVSEIREKKNTVRGCQAPVLMF